MAGGDARPTDLFTFYGQTAAPEELLQKVFRRVRLTHQSIIGIGGDFLLYTIYLANMQLFFRKPKTLISTVNGKYTPRPCRAIAPR